MKSSQSTGGNPPISKPSSVKREPPRAPSPTPSNFTSVTTALHKIYPTPSMSSSPPEVIPSTSSYGGGGGHRPVTNERRGNPPPAPRISIIPLSQLMDPDDQMSTVSSVAPQSRNVHAGSSTPLTHEPLLISSPEPSTVNMETRESDWRMGCRSVVDRLKHILETSNMHQDVIFDVQGQNAKEQFQAHKLILRIASPIFEEIFTKQEASDLQQGPTILPITDVDPFIFKLLLNYIYTDQVDKSSLNEIQLVDLLEASLQYEVTQLYQECFEVLKMGICDNVVIKLCSIASAYCEDNLLELCMTHIARDAGAIFETEDLSLLSRENLIKLVERDDLNIDEVSLFEAAMRWAQYRCMEEGKEINPTNLREILEDVLLKIRFPLMSGQEFTLKIVQTKILTDKEQNEIYQYVCVEKSNMHQLPPTSFNTKPRCPAKLLSPDRDSFSDFTGSGKSHESPDRQDSVASTALADTATEPESETASTVSSHKSDSRKRPKKPSPTSSDSSNKRRRKSSGGGSNKPSKTLRMDDLFGDGEDTSSITLQNTTISLNEFITNCRKMKTRKNVKAIVLNKVAINDYKSLEYRKVHFPNLKQFTLNIQIGETIPKTQNDPFWEKFSLMKFLFFTKTGKEFSYDNLWGMGVRITIIINQVVLLKLNPEKGHEEAILNKFNGGQHILKSLRDQSLKSAVYSYSSLNEKYLPGSLRILTVMGFNRSNNPKCWEDYLQRFKYLRELTLQCTVSATEKDTMTWRIKDTLPFKDKLRKLALSCTSITLEPGLRFPNIKKLYLWKTTWDPNFEAKFHLIFPQLEEVFFQGPMKASHTLLRNIFKLTTLSKFISWQCDWNLGGEEGMKLRDFIQNCSVTESDKKLEKNFIIQRTGDQSWATLGISWLKCQEYNFTLFGLGSLYEDFQAYNK